jgi:hypothetical protein
VTLNFVLLHTQQHDGKRGLQVAELDWSNGSCAVGPVVVTGKVGKLLIDQRDNFRFLSYQKNNEIDKIECVCWHLNSQERRVEQVGERFQLPCNRFHCTNLDNGTVYGISSSLDTLSRFDLTHRRIISEIQLHGGPKSTEFENPRVSFVNMKRVQIKSGTILV